jgi:hypothetical protein
VSGVPTNFLSEEQRRRFGKFSEEPDEGQLAGCFLLDQTARRRARAAKGARNRLGWSVQLGTVRYPGTFLEDPEDVPGVVVDYVAEQLGLPAGDRPVTGGWSTVGTTRTRSGRRTVTPSSSSTSGSPWPAGCTSAWIGSERPTLLFDPAAKRLVDKKVVLPGVTVLERLVSGSRERAERRLWATPPHPRLCHGFLRLARRSYGPTRF